MDIIVCVKQVPGTTEVEIDEKTGTLKRSGIPSKMNPYDLFALEVALRIKDNQGANIKVVSMGPPQAIPTLLETYYMGADEAYLLSDRKFAGSDVHATSYAIAEGIKKAGHFDMIICGKQTTDGDTAQVGPETAEWLGIEHAANVLTIDSLSDSSVDISMNIDGAIQSQRMQFPCLLTIEKDAVTPRLPSYRRKRTVKNEDDIVTVITASDIDNLVEDNCGLEGSPTKVERIFPPEKNTDKTMHEGSADQLSEELFGILKSEKFI